MAELPKDHFRRCARPFYLAGGRQRGRMMIRKSSVPSLGCSLSGKGSMPLAVSLAMVFLAVLLAVSVARAQTLPAFPGAEGFGAMSVGGRGGSVIEVSNLNDSGPGSLRAAIDATGSRTVVFRIGGTIELQSPLAIINPYITIAGQTAPGGGITLKNGTNTGTPLNIQTHDVIIRYLRVRPGPGGEPDGISILYNQSYNIIIDHCSVSWAVDENINTWYDAHDITIQWCFINEGLFFSTHSEGPHSMGALFGSIGSHSISVHHNLFVHNDRRNPMIKTGGLVDFVNNVIYNYGNGAGDLANEYADLPVNYVGNYVKWGQDSDRTEYEVNLAVSRKYNLSVYVHGNIGPHRPDETYDEAAVVSPEDRQFLITAPHPAPPITTLSAGEAYDQVLSNAGAAIGIDGQGHGYWRRDPVDIRIVNDVRNGTGRIINDPYDVGGWPALEEGIPPADSDHDGMPDDWEDLHGLDPVDPTDGPVDADGDGYTNLEDFLASLALPGNLPPEVEAGPDQSITLMETAALSGTVSDDGFPDPPGVLTTVWLQVNGPGTVTFADANAVVTSAGFSEPGTYVLRLTADDSQLAGSDEMSVLVTGAGGEIITEVKVAAGFDDAEEAPSGGLSLTSSDLELVYDGGNQTVGMRFSGVNIPQKATILSAHIQFQVDEATTEAASLIIQGEAADNASPFTTAIGNISSRPVTGESVSWSPVPWTVVGEAGPDQRTPDIASVVQEIVNRSGWTIGNSLAVIITGTGSRIAESYDGDPAGAPVLHVVYIPDSGSTTAPTVTVFDLPETYDSLTVPILTFTATDDIGVTGYLVTESATVPAADNPDWTATPPSSYTFDGDGSQTLYGWAKDAAGNVSTALSDTVIITLSDTTAPTVTAFDLPEIYDSVTVPILSFSASDDTEVTGYLATESSAAPAADNPGWSATPPVVYTFGSAGNQTLYGWAKDAAGNVSTALSDTVVITLSDTTAPTVTAFGLPEIYDSVTVPILNFSASDDTEVTGYLATESATVPAADNPDWSATAPASYTFDADGSQILYGWAKDAAGNVSTALSDTVVITLPDTTPPVVTAFDLPADSSSLTVPIVTFTASDDLGVTGFLATETSTPPEADAPGWSATAPTEHTFGSAGSQTLYGWAKDAADNVSTALSDTVVITLPDTTPPVVTAFDLPADSSSLTVPIVTFAASDDTGVTGYLASETASAPDPDDAAWATHPPASHTFENPGSQILYGWAKDAAGNVSTALSDTVVITLPDTTPPVVTAFDLPADSSSLTVPIVTFTASDDLGVTGFLATETSTPPEADAPGWSATAPTEHTFGSAGIQTLYGWAKDDAGNVSASLSDTVTITLGTNLHVGDLDSSVKVRGKSGKWEVLVTVTVHDQDHSPVAGAVVSGMWSGDANGTVSGTTDGSGNVALGTGNLSSGSEVTFGVTDASLDGSTYDASGNHDPDGDSDGTGITVSRP